jgi:hypothetical protein
MTDSETTNDAQYLLIRQWMDNGIHHTDAWIDGRVVQASSGASSRLATEALAFELLRQLSESLRTDD